MNPCIDYCYVRFGKQYESKCDTECDYAKIAQENKQLKEEIERLKAKEE